MEVRQLWGMTEISPAGTQGALKASEGTQGAALLALEFGMGWVGGWVARWAGGGAARPAASAFGGGGGCSSCADPHMRMAGRRAPPSGTWTGRRLWA